MAHDDIAMRVRRRLRKRRQQLGLTQEQVCEAAGLSLDAISRIEHGSRVPTLATLDKLARALDLDVGELVADDEPRAPDVPKPIARVVGLLRPQPAAVQQAAEAVVVAFLRALKKSPPPPTR
jgi:transcriptional regulator with XRE-family HTH domain